MVWLAACSGGNSDVEQPSGTTQAEVIPAFGDGSIGSVQVDVIGTSADGLFVPRDLEFNPGVAGELWVVNRADDSVSIFHDAGTADQSSEHRIDPFALHFMEEVSSISFGAASFSGSSALTFGTCQESRNTYNGGGNPNDFMGPSLWTADLDLFAKSNPEAVQFLTEEFGFPADLGSHLDMLHESPMCMGMAWETENVYWVYDGRNAVIARYDFQADHDLGYDDHSDGIIYKTTIEVDREPDVPSHMVIDPNTLTLYAVDTGNNRVLAINTQTGTPGKDLPVTERGTVHKQFDDVEYSVLIDGDAVGMSKPSGLALVEDTLIVTDFETGAIHAFDLEGTLLQTLETGRTDALMGIEAVSLSDLWVVDSAAQEIIRIQP